MTIMAQEKQEGPTVRRERLGGKSPAECVAFAARVCGAGAACEEVLCSPLGAPAYAALREAIAAAQASLLRRLSLAAALADASRAVKADVARVVAALRDYEAVVEIVAAGDAAVIRAAGLCAGEDGPGTAAVPRQATDVRPRPGERANVEPRRRAPLQARPGPAISPILPAR
jgi:hypothetical protein